jgi:hypothetical protein
MQKHDKLQKNEMNAPVLLPITIFRKCWEKHSSKSFFQYDVSANYTLAKLYFQKKLELMFLTPASYRI